MEGEDKIAYFCSLTGSDPDTAEKFISATEDIGSAVELFFATNDTQPKDNTDAHSISPTSTFIFSFSPT